MQRLFALSTGLVLCAAACTSAAPSAPTAAPAAPTTAAVKPATAPSPSAAASPSASPGRAASAVPSASAIASPSPTNASAPRPANATLTITSPTAGQTVPAGSITISIQYSGPQLVAAASATKIDDYHLHYFLDENASPYLNSLTPVPTGNPHIVHTASLQTTFDNVAAGSHTATVMFSGANHVTVTPPLSAQVTFTVQ